MLKATLPFVSASESEVTANFMSAANWIRHARNLKQTSRLPHVAALVCDHLLEDGYEPRRPGALGPPGCEHDDDLHPCLEQLAGGESEALWTDSPLSSLRRGHNGIMPVSHNRIMPVSICHLRSVPGALTSPWKGKRIAAVVGGFRSGIGWSAYSIVRRAIVPGKVLA